MRAITLALLVGLAFIYACNDDKQEAQAPPELEEGDSIITTLPEQKPVQTGVVLIRHADSTYTLVWVDNKHRGKYISFGEGGDIEPEETHRQGPFDGKAVDFENLAIPWAKMDPSVFLPYPTPPAGDTSNVEFKRRYKERVEQDRKEDGRTVFVTQHGPPPNEYVIIRVFNGVGELILTKRKAGTFKGFTLNEDTGEKVIIVEEAGQIQWVLIDYTTGTVLIDSRFGLAIDTPVVSVELVGNSVVVIQRWRNGGWIRVRVFGLDGQLQHVYDIPGEYVTSTTNGTNIKALVFQDGDKVYQDLLKITDGTRLSGVTGLPQNGIKGTHLHLQYDKVGNEERFVEVVKDPDRNEVVVRILNGQGQLISTQVLPGEFKRVIKHNGRKVFIMKRPGDFDFITINLTSGRQEHIVSRPGTQIKYRVMLDRLGNMTVKIDGRELSFKILP